ncbi:peptide/nickel transport system permease protein [Pseudochelatococcus lubricantis]|uniref:Peptide/nickel transport system permease protein n=1 Tax=Pseudochelatococcus lubricantis TaxID=1538102 RepID=A0ABX0V4K4_9HYPH|nr:ABC transporter permease [Pseudochelatococcus lubricantis]NIJ58720.1 peptide/nickel transport system permease protein [Pseudochelatococcus lubricantis]
MSSPFRQKLRRFFSHRTAAVGLSITLFVIIAVILGPMILPHDPEMVDFMAVLVPPGFAHPLGTDSFGRDVLSRVLAGGRVSFGISFAAITLAAAAGAMMGIAAGYFRGWCENVLMRIADLLFAFPSFILALLLMVLFGFSTVNIIFAIALVYLPIFARISRNATMLIREEPFIQAARLMGRSPGAIMLTDILPNIATPLLVQASAGLAFAIILEAGLSFIGLGVQPPTPSLGGIMADGREYFSRAPWVLTMSGLAISFALLGINLLGDGLRDLTDPRLRERM